MIRCVLVDADEPLSVAEIADEIGRDLPTRNPRNYTRTILYRRSSELLRVDGKYALTESDLGDVLREQYPERIRAVSPDLVPR